MIIHPVHSPEVFNDTVAELTPRQQIAFNGFGEAARIWGSDNAVLGDRSYALERRVHERLEQILDSGFNFQDRLNLADGAAICQGSPGAQAYLNQCIFHITSGLSGETPPVGAGRGVEGVNLMFRTTLFNVARLFAEVS